ncbi:spore coat U domain-containing protein [Ochrobactrum sp. AP1BH01-1]|nr:spore coat U domain-containing protein [Ochrobactrum sp. AP1BH01-1]
MRFILSSLIGMVLSMGPALSATKTSTFDVKIQINAECQINSTNNLDFGSTGVISAAIDATSTIAVQCTNGTPYNIGISAGLGASATTAARLMTGPNSATVTYSLYSDAGRASVWGDIIGTDTRAGTGTGAEQTYDVYGRIPVQPTPGAGSYSDTVTVTLTY